MNTHYNYYIYSVSIARIDNKGTAEIKNHKTDTWNKIENGDFYRRIQQEGELVSKEDAENFYNEQRKRLSS